MEGASVQVAEQSASIIKFAASFVKAQLEICGATKDKKNPHFGNSYADLSSVMEACKESLNKHGIAIIQTPAPSEAGRLGLTTKLLHESGEWMSGTGAIPIDRNGPQAYGSALTYARRYFLAAMVGVCPEDDDAEGATNRGQAQAKLQTGPPAPPPANDNFLIEIDEAFDAREAEAQKTDSAFKFASVDRRVIKSGVAKRCGVESVAEIPKERRPELLKKIIGGEFDHIRKAAKKPEMATA